MEDGAGIKPCRLHSAAQPGDAFGVFGGFDLKCGHGTPSPPAPLPLRERGAGWFVIVPLPLRERVARQRRVRAVVISALRPRLSAPSYNRTIMLARSRG